MKRLSVTHSSCGGGYATQPPKVSSDGREARIMHSNLYIASLCARGNFAYGEYGRRRSPKFPDLQQTLILHDEADRLKEKGIYIFPSTQVHITTKPLPVEQPTKPCEGEEEERGHSWNTGVTSMVHQVHYLAR